MNDELHDLLKIARLYYNENLTQQEIAKKVNLSRIKVHRMLLKARNDGIVEITIHDPLEEYSELEIKLENRYNLKECIIVPSSEKPEGVFPAMGRALSKILEHTLTPDSFLGVGWGTTIRGVAENLFIRKKVKAKIIPMVGGLGPSEEQIHSNSIVSLISSRIGGTGYVLNCPAIVENKRAKTFFMNEPSVKEIFSLSKSISTAIVSLSDISRDITIRRLNIISDEDCTYLQSLGLIGDVNANFFTKDGEMKKNRLDDRIINMKPNDLSQKRNVIGIAFGKRKVLTIKTAMQAGYTNTIITDKDTADAILAMDSAGK